MADGCQHVYIDLGSNVGVQVRKLFEPHLYVPSKSIPIFDRFFGVSEVRRESTCAFGFEMNWVHTEKLRRIERAYNRVGWRTRFFAETGVGTDFAVVKNDYKPSHPTEDFAVGASIPFPTNSTEPRDGGSSDVAHSVRIVDIGAFINDVAARRTEPDGGRIVMKMDIEGWEFPVLPHLLYTKNLCKVDFIYIEMHAIVPTFLPHVRSALARAKCPTELFELDDEYLGESNFPLPNLL